MCWLLAMKFINHNVHSNSFIAFEMFFYNVLR